MRISNESITFFKPDLSQRFYLRFWFSPKNPKVKTKDMAVLDSFLLTGHKNYFKFWEANIQIKNKYIRFYVPEKNRRFYLEFCFNPKGSESKIMRVLIDTYHRSGTNVYFDFWNMKIYKDRVEFELNGFLLLFFPSTELLGTEMRLCTPSLEYTFISF